MRVIGGNLKGRNFFMPKGVRPTPDRVRKSIFDMLGQDLTGSTFIDLFAGSGAVGLEALSRNAEFVYFVEKDIHFADIISENLTRLKVSDDQINRHVFVATSDAFTAIKQLHHQKKKFDIAFVDPPYSRDLAKKALKTLSAYDILHPACFLLIQHEKREILPESEGRFVLLRTKKYGSSLVTLYEGKAT